MQEYSEANNVSKLNTIKKGFDLTRYNVMTVLGMYFLPGYLTEPYKKFIALFGHIFITFSLICIIDTIRDNLKYMNILFDTGVLLVLIGGVELSVVSYRYYQDNLNHLLYVIGSGFYVYQGEENTDEENEKQNKFNAFNKKLTKQYSLLIFFTINTYQLTNPIMQYLNEQKIEGNIDYRLPALITYPYNTKESNFGYAMACLSILILGIFVLYGVIGLDLSCYLMMLQLKNQLQILNYKIKRLEERSMKRMGIKNINLYKDKLWTNREFMHNLNLCLKENIRHHQQIIKYLNVTQKTYGNSYMIVLGNASVLIAGSGYLVTENPAFGIIMRAVLVTATVFIHIFLYCYFGQALLDQSSELSENLYNCPWYKCEMKFKKSLLIMMGMAYKPLKHKSHFLNQELTLATFGEVARLAYSFLNLIRQM